jgi:hypothetical protein
LACSTHNLAWRAAHTALLGVRACVPRGRSRSSAQRGRAGNLIGGTQGNAAARGSFNTRDGLGGQASAALAALAAPRRTARRSCAWTAPSTSSQRSTGALDRSPCHDRSAPAHASPGSKRTRPSLPGRCGISVLFQQCGKTTLRTPDSASALWCCCQVGTAHMARAGVHPRGGAVPLVVRSRGRASQALGPGPAGGRGGRPAARTALAHDLPLTLAARRVKSWNDKVSKVRAGPAGPARVGWNGRRAASRAAPS